VPKTTSAARRRQARRQLDRRCATLRTQIPSFVMPRSGWLRAVREALGMSAKDLAARLGVSESTVVRLEMSERAQTAQLDSLRRAADALGCDLVYALVPRRPLEDTVGEQARKRAREDLTRVRHTMLLEEQTPDRSDLDDLVSDTASEWVDRPGLWHV
jgi:predicted DNA-binding mobile mystery protein A